MLINTSKCNKWSAVNKSQLDLLLNNANGQIRGRSITNQLDRRQNRKWICALYIDPLWRNQTGFDYCGCYKKGSSLQITLLGATENSKAAAVHFFFAGDVVTVELERRHGQDGVMRVRVAGKAFVRDMTGLPRDGMLYPAVDLWSTEQSYTMVAAP